MEAIISPHVTKDLPECRCRILSALKDCGDVVSLRSDGPHMRGVHLRSRASEGRSPPSWGSPVDQTRTLSVPWSCWLMTANVLQSALLGSAMLLSRCCPRGAQVPLSRRRLAQHLDEVG